MSTSTSTTNSQKDFTHCLYRNGELSSFRQLDYCYRLPNHNDVEYKDLQMISHRSSLHLNPPS